MKLLIAFVFSFAAFSAFSADLKSTITEIEADESARCTRTRGSLMNLCSGSVTNMGGHSEMYSCTYTVSYKCSSHTSAPDFKVKLRVTESYNEDTEMRESRVVKVTYLR